MMSFEEIVHDLGRTLNISLHVDSRLACALKMQGKFVVQLQFDSAQERLLVAAFLYELPPGRFRENVLLEALKTNCLPDPSVGILGYLSSSNRLTMHQRYPLASLTPDTCSLWIASFIEAATLWYNALEKGETSPSPILSNTPKKPPFGMIR